MIRKVYLFLLLTAVMTSVMAAEPPPAVTMKLNYAKLVVMTSSNAQRIQDSDNEKAKARLKTAREKYSQAATAAEKGDFKRAESLASEAMLLVVSAARMVPDAAVQEQQARKRYAGLLQQIDTYSKWYWKFHDKNLPHDQEVDKVMADVEEAKRVAEAGNYIDSNERLSALLNILIAKTDDSLSEQRTVTYDLKFETPDKEYDYELSRNQEFERLVALALKQKQPSAGVRGLIKRYVKKALTQRAEAEKYRESEGFEMAIKQLRSATGQFETALKMAGVR